MRLLIISHMPHHLRDGVVVGWGPTARELDQLATRFTSVRHVACLHPEPAPASDIPYTARNIELVPVPPSGADGFLGKLDVLRTSPKYLAAILRELPHADMVHVRAPAHIALMAMLILSLRKRPTARWFKYAGNWQPDVLESPSYIFQRWWLRRPWHRGVVTVNGDWPAQQTWVRTFFNPSLEASDLERGRAAAATKQLTTPMRMVYVGRVETAKGAGRAVEVLARLRQQGIDATLELIGDGDERPTIEARAVALGVADRAQFVGWQSPSYVYQAFARAHVQLLPTAACEGWPKVLSEGMAYGVVPVAGNVSSIPQYVKQFATGAALAPDDVDGFAAVLASYARDPVKWARESANAVAATRWFTFDQYLSSIDSLLSDLGGPEHEAECRLQRAPS
ncbi:MAG: glycosyltransferase [Deltaproteobacteria bacterium]|nr:glycosyltransferase [Deltaproteobacteria bacterium]